VQTPKQRKVSLGEALKAMVLNGLGLIDQRLYLTTQFFETLPTERLLGRGIRPKHLNDDMLGRTLDTVLTSMASRSCFETWLPIRLRGSA
jgi:transposase